MVASDDDEEEVAGSGAVGPARTPAGSPADDDDEDEAAGSGVAGSARMRAGRICAATLTLPRKPNY
uniref:Uncharacterized protein n=1 Tax=Oryza punctata TaxID=4537 RepID=A0A0E0JK86_ORYPU